MFVGHHISIGLSPGGWSDYVGSPRHPRPMGFSRRKNPAFRLGKTMSFLPPMTGNGNFIPQKFLFDDWGIVQMAFFYHLLPTFDHFPWKQPHVFDRAGVSISIFP